MTTYKLSILMTGFAVCLCTISGQAEPQNTLGQSEAKVTQGNQVIEQLGEPINGFTLTTKFDKAVFKDGEPIKVAFRLKNLRTTTEYFVRRRDVNDFALKVTTADDKIVPLTAYGRAMYEGPVFGSSVNIKMKEGDEVNGALQVNRIYDMSQGGKYNITVSTTMPTDRTVVTSKTTTVTVSFGD